MDLLYDDILNVADLNVQNNDEFRKKYGKGGVVIMTLKHKVKFFDLSRSIESSMLKSNTGTILFS
jgi:hypothetical protein